MAAFILPRSCFTDHPLTIHAAGQMIDLVDRAGHFRAVKPIDGFARHDGASRFR